MAEARVIVFIMPVDFIARQLCEDSHSRCDSHSALHDMRACKSWQGCSLTTTDATIANGTSLETDLA